MSAAAGLADANALVYAFPFDRRAAAAQALPAAARSIRIHFSEKRMPGLPRNLIRRFAVASIEQFRLKEPAP
jgi:hypothetical protein